MDDTAPDNWGSIFFSQIYCPFDSSYFSCYVVCHNFWLIFTENGKEISNSQTGGGSHIAPFRKYSSGNSAMDIVFMDYWESSFLGCKVGCC